MRIFSKILFFIGYYFKKHFNGNITAKDIFKKRIFRLMSKVPGEILMNSNSELLYKIYQKEYAVKLLIRNELSSDVRVMHQVFANKEYFPLIEEIKYHDKMEDIKLIVDAGGNVGYVTSYLKSYFPDCSVIIIEPDSGNVLQIKKNISLNKFKNVNILEGGLWPVDAWLELKQDFRDGKEWSGYVVESIKPTMLKGYSFQSILKETIHPIIDILKIDIEGGEKYLFASSDIISPILKKTRFLALEIHDETGFRSDIYNILKYNGFIWFNKGELTIATNMNLI